MLYPTFHASGQLAGWDFSFSGGIALIISIVSIETVTTRSTRFTM